MALSDFAKTYALEFARSIWQAARPQAYLGEGSEIAHTILLPVALIHAALHQEVEVLRQSYLGRASELSEDIVSLLATNFPGAQWPMGARATTTVRVYVSTAVVMRFDTAPYFRTPSGIQFRPLAPVTIRAVDFRRDDAGELYADILCTSVDYGAQASAGDVSLFVDLPDEVRRVENLDEATGGRARATGLEFYESIKSTRSDGSLVQAGGTVAYVRRNFEQVRRAEVVGAGDPYMTRDEIWSVDGVTPNFVRDGAPLGEHVSLGVLDFDIQLGRAYASSDVFNEGMVGRRVAIAGDQDVYRTIVRFVSERSVVLSGDPLHGTASATLWSDGPHTGGKADVYLYIPLLHASYQVVDRRLYLRTTLAAVSASTKLYVSPQVGRIYQELPSTGVAVIAPGTSSRRRLRVVGVGLDADGTYLELYSTVGVIVDSGARVDLWPSDPIRIAPDGDITSLPVMFVAQVQELDEVTLEPVLDVSETRSGPYAAPGWRIVTPDGSRVFSSKEDKLLIMDTKRDVASYAPAALSGCAIVGSSQVSGQQDIVQRSGHDFTYTEGREVRVLVPERVINQANIASIVVTAVTTTQITVAGANIQFFTEDGWRTGLVLTYTYLGAPQVVPARGKGSIVEREDGGSFPGVPANYSTMAIAFPGSSSRASYELEAVIARAAGDEIEILVDGGIRAISGKPQTQVSGVIVELDDLQGQFDASPVGITYYTHPDFELLQDALDNGANRLNARDQLARSYLPAVIDMTMEYRGRATPDEIQRRLVSLIQEADRARVEDGELRLDISDVISAIDEEGFTSSYQTDFEVRVTSWLADGEKTVRYLNPSINTKQRFAVASAAAPGASRVTLRQTARTTAVPPGRGKIVLGGLNPDAYEVLAYEAVVDDGGGQYTFILRGEQEVEYNHPQWEEAIVGVRDWDPDLEFESEIIVPSVCRPYLGQAVLIRRT